ncbi:MAG: double-strand break repair helicase AddA [Xanthobacteraceae bacterium]
MNAPRPVPADVLNRQIAASDPLVSAWVAANAGSGKTHVLAQRVIRLLLDGCAPSRILCLTFTKAAAANMAKRVFDTLARWTALDDAALDAELRQIGIKKVDAARRAHARRLFAAALDTPGGLKVQTIHAFCTRLLHQFPFEANVAARFAVLEERAEAELIDKLRLEVLMLAAAAPDGPLGQALSTAITAAADQTFADLVREAIAERAALTAWIDHVGSIEAAVADLSGALGIDSADSNERIDAEIVEGPILPLSRWTAVAAVLATGSASDRNQSDCLCRAAAAQGGERITNYRQFFTTKGGEPRQSLLTRGLANRHPDLAQQLAAEQERVCALLERRRAVATRDRTGALIAIAGEVISRYRAEKERRGLLDYDDLIDKTLAMLTTVNPSWVHYKLDLGIDHVLIDEAQDTSPKQWEVIRRLVSEFTAGAGARGALTRSIFAVGDEKQSIFSFQGAAPHYFADMRRHFESAHKDSGLGFVALDFKYSFRSAPAVLDAVDGVFARPEAYAGLTADPVKTVHQAVREKAPGVVEIWPLVEAEEKREIEGWDAPFDELSETSPVIKLAHRIATSARKWLTSGERVSDPVTGALRPMRPGDVLILVRQRGALFEAIIRALKANNIAVAGADRLLLTEHIAVMDLMVLADALLLASDDLALATVLKSPLFELDDDALFALAWNRRGTLWDELSAKAKTNPVFAEAAATLERWAHGAQYRPPFAFYADVLGPGGGRARMLKRLGAEAADALDEFLNLALDYEARETPSLQGFVAWLRATTTEVKRDMEIARDEVRVMTVHGAKGLEAPVVILADTTTNPAGPRPPRLLAMPAAGSPDTPDRIVWAGAKETDVPPVAAARTRAVRAAEEEDRRLLYVAMTRAADRLIVCGATGQRKRPDGCWYDLVRDALEPIAVTEPAESGDEPVLRLQKWQVTEFQPELPLAAAPATWPCPDWLTRKLEGQSSPAIVRPSGALDEQDTMTASVGMDDDRRRALARGTLMHRLLQSLPDIAPERRAGAARRYLDGAGRLFTEVERAGMTGQVLALLDDPRFAPLAAPGSRAEVPIVGRLARNGLPPYPVSGQVDRLAVTPEQVLIADYKTDRPAPRRHEDVKEEYRTQLALYRAVLAGLYPERAVRALLVWTEIPHFMEIPAATLDAARARVTLE